MPDFILIVLMFIVSVIFGISTICFLSEKTSGTRKCFLNFGMLLVCLASWFFIGYNRSWHPYKVENLHILQKPVGDGSFYQYVEGHDNGVGLPARRRNENERMYSVFYPPGTIVKRSYYNPWQTGIYWSNTITEEYVLP